MEEMNFDEMREQFTLLRHKLDQQDIINDSLLRETMRGRIGAINRTKYKSYICAAFSLALYPLLLYWGVFSNAFVIATCIMMLFCAYGTYYVHTPVDRMNLMTEDLATDHWLMALPLLIGAAIGGLIGYIWHCKAVNAADNIIRQIEENN